MTKRLGNQAASACRTSAAFAPQCASALNPPHPRLKPTTGGNGSNEMSASSPARWAPSPPFGMEERDGERRSAGEFHPPSPGVGLTGTAR
jgi:hypothetical protein